MSLGRNALFNVAGALVPAVAALLTVPVLVAQLGSAELGVLFLVTSVVGYFALLDINATAGSVKYIAQHQAEGDLPRVRRVFSFGVLLYAGIGLVGGLALLLAADALVLRVFRVPAELQAEAVAALRWSALAFFLGQLQQYLHSVPQALQRYDISGRLEAVFGTLASLTTLAVVWAGFGLLGVVLARLVLSAINLGVLAHRVVGLLPGGLWLRPDGDTARAVGRFSAHAYLARLAALSAGHTDKLLIGAMVDMRALAWYSVPFMLVNRVFQVSFRLAQVMFPRASALSAAGAEQQLRSNYLAAGRYVGYVNAVLLGLLALTAPEIIRYWAGGDFGAAAVAVLVCVAMAAFVDSLTNVPSVVNDGLGHPAVSGVAAVLRALVGLAAAWWAIGQHGIVGAALAQLAVSVLGTALFLRYVHGRTVPVALSLYLRQVVLPLLPAWALGVGLGAWSLAREPWPLPTALAAVLALLLLQLGYAWWAVVQPAHRQRALAQWRALAAARG